MVILIWLQVGFAMILLSSAIKGVPEDTLEAARIDGASEVQIFFQVVIPQIKGTIVTVFITVLILVMKVFDIVYVLTNGRFESNVIANLFFNELFTNSQARAGHGDRRRPAHRGHPRADLPGRHFRQRRRNAMSAPDALTKDGRPTAASSRSSTHAVLVILWTIPDARPARHLVPDPGRRGVAGWWSALFNPVRTPGSTPDNYQRVFEGTDIGTGLLNSIIVAIPATVIPIMFAAFAAYAFTFMDFRGKDVLFIVVVGLLVVPIQVAFQPMLDLLGPRGLGISGQFIAVWLLHTGFGMPLAIYTLRNYMATLPVSVVESAKIDGCSHYQTFWKLVAPMSVPAIAAFATLQFLWVWNDLLIAKLFLSSGNSTVIVQVQQLLGTQGQGKELLTAAAFVSMVIPMIVFFALQRFFVRGLTSGAVKG